MEAFLEQLRIATEEVKNNKRYSQDHLDAILEMRNIYKKASQKDKEAIVRMDNEIRYAGFWDRLLFYTQREILDNLTEEELKECQINGDFKFATFIKSADSDNIGFQYNEFSTPFHKLPPEAQAELKEKMKRRMAEERELRYMDPVERNRKLNRNPIQQQRWGISEIE